LKKILRGGGGGRLKECLENVSVLLPPLAEADRNAGRGYRSAGDNQKSVSGFSSKKVLTSPKIRILKIGGPNGIRTRVCG